MKGIDKLSISNEVFIFGTGKYGTALYAFLNEKKIQIKGFIQTNIGEINNYFGIPIYDLKTFTSVKRRNSIVLLAIADEKVRKYVRTVLTIEKAVLMDNIVDCAAFIETNCMGNKRGKYCILCGNYVDDFLEHGEDAPCFVNHVMVGAGKRKNAKCPLCTGIDRNRWCYYVISHFTDMLSTECKVLHFAPERGIIDLIQTNARCSYVSADIDKNKAMLAIDATDIPFRNEEFDYIIANHVLEHIADDNRALKEFKRVLKVGGVAIVSFPICLDRITYEDKTVITPEERLQKFGHRGHVRIYGTDYKKRLEAAGFEVEIKSSEEELTKKIMEEFGFWEKDVILLLRKKQ